MDTEGKAVEPCGILRLLLQAIQDGRLIVGPSGPVGGGSLVSLVSINMVTDKPSILTSH